MTLEEEYKRIDKRARAALRRRQDEKYKQTGKMAGAAMRRRQDEESLAMMDYFGGHFDELLNC